MRKKKEQDVRLSEKELSKLKSSMSKSERKVFEKRQRDAEEEKFFDEMAFLMAFWDE
ncbi:MAG: hypothetical protein LUE29_04195 [Lachnospiraceae bacterium]|nr:hypothetical protein [Lachnospiraceae bacterium]